jgi:ABC-type Fe3+-hydroxamate transport system substrate-binding protein
MMVELFSEVLGKSVHVPEPPKRMVSFSPAVTEILFELGLGESVIGVSAFCARPPATKLKRRVGSYNTVSNELLDDLKPDLILTTTGYQRDFALRLSERYPVYPFELPVSVAGIIDTVVKVGLVTSVPDRARDFAGFLLGRLEGVRRKRRLRAYVEIDLGGPVSFGAHSYIVDAFKLLGSSTLFENERTEWLTPNLEAVRGMDPDMLVYEPKMYSRFDPEDAGTMVRSRGWEEMRAVRAGNLFVTPGPLDFLAHHGPSFITDALPWLGDKLEAAATRV